MVFTSLLFLFLFLPSVLVAYFLIPNKMGKNLLLLVASLVFYAFGEVSQFWVIAAFILLNFAAARMIEACTISARRKWLMWTAVGLNLGLLGYFKYSGFLAENANRLFAKLGWDSIPVPHPILPLGISFFTFQGLTYVVDVYHGRVGAQRSLLNFAMYKSFFPQLIAGPIVRYSDVSNQINERTVTLDLFASGVERFIVGLGKKVLIANTLAVPADLLFKLPAHELSTAQAWLALLCYTFQIYFDFSGYSDMAIGMGRMFGFRFLENFNYPYMAQSVTDFWRRWHISLSSVLRDYLYIPLGGSRAGPVRTYVNLWIVFLLCGLWHGASWTFVIWGAHHGLFLAMERGLGKYVPSVVRTILGTPYTLAVVMIGWVFFRCDTLSHARGFLKAILGKGSGQASVLSIYPYLTETVSIALLLGAICSISWLPWIGTWEKKRSMGIKSALCTFRLIGLCGLFFCCLVRLGAGTYNPFIYFRF